MITTTNTKTSARTIAKALLLSGNTGLIDLDGVLFSAAHRQNCHPDGSLNLTKYRENSTPEKIAQDQDLPLMELVRILNANNHPYHVVTARVNCASTAKLLHDRGVKPLSVMARSGEHDNRKDSVLKSDHIASNFDLRQRENMTLIDDNLNNCKALIQLGCSAIHVPFEGH